MDTNATVLLDFVLMTQTHPFALQVEPLILLEMSPVQHQCRPVVFSTCNMRVLLLSAMERVVFEPSHQETYESVKLGFLLFPDCDGDAHVPVPMVSDKN
jgi:hypothetical protein